LSNFEDKKFVRKLFGRSGASSNRFLGARLPLRRRALLLEPVDRDGRVLRLLNDRHLVETTFIDKNSSTLSLFFAGRSIEKKAVGLISFGHFLSTFCVFPCHNTLASSDMALLILKPHGFRFKIHMLKG
jgi:hypothetical protein